MALLASKAKEDIPKDAVMISDSRAIFYQFEIISNWPKFSDVYAWKSATPVLSGLSVVSSVLINNHFRYKLKLGNYGRFSSYLAVVAAPLLFTNLFHKTFVQAPIVLQAYECPLCIQTRSALLQGGMGVAYPFFLAPMAAFMFATRHFTYRMPSLTTQPKEVLSLWLKFTRSYKTAGSVLLGINMVVAMFIASREMQELAFINLELQEHERKVESGYFQ